MTRTIRDNLNIGIIQVVLDNVAAWADGPEMARQEADNAFYQIEMGFRSFRDAGQEPDVVLIPELTIPRHRLTDVQKMATSIGAIVIGGLDYRFSAEERGYVNEGVVIVPRNFNAVKQLSRPLIRYIRKTYPAPAELKYFEDKKSQFAGDSTVPIFNGEEIGNFAVAICYDLTDIHRLALYRTHIQHLFILAYNKDLNSFRHLAEAVARVNFTNVVICNTGRYGGSLCLAPYYDPNQRVIFSSEGQNLFISQIFQIEVKSLIEHQNGIRNVRWKSLPPGFPQTGNTPLILNKDDIFAFT